MTAVWRLRRWWIGALPAVALACGGPPLAAQDNPRPKPVLPPSTFEPNVDSTEALVPTGENPNVFSPWFDAVEVMALPDDFDFEGASKATLMGLSEAAAADYEPPPMAPNVPFNDLFIEDETGSLLQTSDGFAFAAQGLLLRPGPGAYDQLSREAILPFGEYNWPSEVVPRSVPIFKRVRRLLPVGPFRVGVDLGGSVAYNNNVYGETTNPKGDMVSSLLPTVYLEAGTRGSVQLLYTPALVRYSRYPELGSTNQSVFFRMRYPFTKLKLGLDAFYLSDSGLFVNSEGFAKQTTLVGRMLGEYPLTSKTNLLGTLESVYRDPQPGGNQLDTSAKVTLYYRVTPSLRAGGSLRVGTFTAPADQQTYQSVQANLAWNISPAFFFLGEAGMELRQLGFFANGSSQLNTAVFNLQLTYNPTSTTVFSLGLYRDILNTTFNDVSLNINTGINFATTIRLFERLHFRLEIGCGITEQFSEQPDNDGSFSFLQGAVILSYQISDLVEFQIFNNFITRFNSQVGDDYSSNTFGMAVILKF